MSLFKTFFAEYRGLPREIYVLFIAHIITNIGSFVQPLLALILTQKIGLGSSSAGNDHRRQTGGQHRTQKSLVSLSSRRRTRRSRLRIRPAVDANGFHAHAFIRALLCRTASI